MARDRPIAIPFAAESRAATTSTGLVRHLASAPFVYGMLAPLAVLDATVSFYQAVCFRLWRVDRASRSAYVVLARHDLPYLTPLQRVHCAYCSYANGVLAYASEIASRSEQYWCPIKHETTPPAPHSRYAEFLVYGDGFEVQRRMKALRRAVQQTGLAANDATPQAREP